MVLEAMASPTTLKQLFVPRGTGPAPLRIDLIGSQPSGWRATPIPVAQERRDVMGVDLKPANLKQTAKQLFEQGRQVTQPLNDVHEKNEKYKGLYELSKNLIEPDTRGATLFKESLNSLITAAGKMLLKDLTRHPYFILNQAAMEALFEAITAAKTINNARQLLGNAEKELNKLRRAAAEFTTHSGKSHGYRRHALVAILKQFNPLKVDWINYVNDLNRDRFATSTRDEAEDEVENALQMAAVLLDELRPDVDLTLSVGYMQFQKHAALAAAGAYIVLAEKAYTETVAKLAGSTGTIPSEFERLEDTCRMYVKGMDALKITTGAAKSLAERVASVMEGPNKVLADWRDLIEACSAAELLLSLDVRGRHLPWDVPRPAASRQIPHCVSPVL
jgi:hypothetical protein